VGKIKNYRFDKKRTIKVVNLIIFIAINIVLFLISYNINDNNWTFSFTIVTILQLFVNIFYLMSLGEKPFSLCILFVILLYMFNFGHLILNSFNIDVVRYFDAITLVPLYIYKKSCIFIGLVQFFLVLGMSFPWLKSDNIIEDNIINEKQDKEIIFKIGVLLVLIGIIPKLYLDIQKIILYMKGNYLSTFEIVFYGSGIVSIFANIVNVGIIMIIIAKQKNIKLCRLIFFITVIYNLIIIMTGNRGLPVVYLLALIFIYFNLVQKPSIKNLVIWASTGYFGIVLINTIGNIRGSSEKSLNIFADAFSQSLQNSPIFKALGEFGGTLISLCYSMMYLSDNTKYGINYLESLFTIFPNINGFLISLNRDYVFLYQIPTKLTLGGSIVAELFYSFNMFGIVFAIVIGIFIGTISKSIFTSIKQEKWLNLSIYMILFPSILWWIRDYFANMVRQFVWTSVLILIFYYLMKPKKVMTINKYTKLL
jgi:hypothetical protein